MRLTDSDRAVLAAVEGGGQPGTSPAERRTLRRLRMLRLVGRERGKPDAALQATARGQKAGKAETPRETPPTPKPREPKG